MTQLQKYLVFDVNETLLDVQGLSPLFESVFGEGKLVREWYSQALQYSLTATITETYSDFSAISSAVLQMMVESRGKTWTTAIQQDFQEAVAQLQPHPDVAPALERLKSAGFRMATLTNSAPKVIERQLQNTGFRKYFEHVLSVDAAKRYKPAKEAYALAVDAFGVEPAALCLVAAHAWDVSGAMAAGFRGAYVARSGRSFFPLGAKPDVSGADMLAVAAALIDKAER